MTTRLTKRGQANRVAIRCPEVARQVRGQASLEYMIMLAFSLAIFAGMIYVVTDMFTRIPTEMGVNYAFSSVQSVKEGADFVYIHGDPSKTQKEIYIPKNVELVAIQNSTVSNETKTWILVRLSVGQSYTDVYAVTRGVMNGTLSEIDHEGRYVLSFDSTPNNPPISNGTINVFVL